MHERSTAIILLAAAFVSRARAAEPSVVECLTASEASFQFANQHKLRAERSQLLVCAAASCPPDIRKECLRRVEELNQAIPTIVFDVRDPTGADVNAVKVWMDDELLSTALDGRALAVDPGEHRFRFEAPGHAALEIALRIRESEKHRRHRVDWPHVDAKRGMPAERRLPQAKLGAQQVSALMVGGVALVGLGVGVAFGLEGLSRKQRAESICPADRCPTQEGVNLWNDAQSAAHVSTLAFVTAGVGLASAAVLWATHDSGGNPVQVSIGLGRVQLKGSW